MNGYLPQMNERLTLIRHETNQGVGGAIATGYEWCRDHEMDVAVVMAGDAQMDPADLPTQYQSCCQGMAQLEQRSRGVEAQENMVAIEGEWNWR